MKKTIILFALILVSNQSKAQNKTQTLFNSTMKLSGWFVELPITYTEIYEQELFMPGLSAGIVLNKSFRIGLTGSDYSNHLSRIYIPEADKGLGGHLKGNEGGLYIEPVIRNEKLIHLTFPIVIGGGYAEIESKTQYPDEDNEMDEKDLAEQRYILFKPSIQMEINFHQNMRFAIGAAYRLTYGNQSEHLSTYALSGYTANVSLKIGVF